MDEPSEDIRSVFHVNRADTLLLCAEHSDLSLFCLFIHVNLEWGILDMHMVTLHIKTK